MDNESLKPQEINNNPQPEIKKAKKANKPKKEKTSSPKNRKKAGIIVLIIGLFALATGIALLIVNLLAKPAVRDADFLVSTGEWEMVDAPGVIWKFAEVGKGTLTTNNHVNDYEFLWSLDKDKLIIETNWLYTLDNEFTYKLDQDEPVLTLTVGEGEELSNIYFRPASHVDTEVTEDN